LWEARPIFYLVAMLILATNLVRERAHVNNLMVIAIAAIAIESVLGINYVVNGLQGNISQVEQIAQHAAAVHQNTFFVLLIAAFIYRASPAKRTVLPLLAPFVAIAYLAAQRRAAFLTLGIAILLIFIILYKENRRAFWLIVPPLAIIGLLYVAVFWNSESALALPAQAVKSVLASNQASYKDRSSNFFRLLENLKISFTIHQATLQGVGFGNQYYTRFPLPDISFFEWWQYFTHNSILWIWMKTGIIGFIALVYFVGTAITTGVRALWRMPGGDMSAIALVATLYIVMHFAYAYVDISWDSQSMVYLGVMMGLVNSLERIVGQPALSRAAQPERRLAKG
jgi:hypothetical protein